MLTAPRGEARGYLPTVTLSGAAKAKPKPRSRTGLFCHFDRGKEQLRLTEWRNLARCVSKDKCLYSTLGFPLGGSCHEVTDEGCWLLCIPTPLFCRLRRHLPPRGKASLRRCVAYAARESCNKKRRNIVVPSFLMSGIGRAAFSAAGQFFLSGPPHCGRRAAIISLAAFTPSTRAMTSVRSTGLP